MFGSLPTIVEHLDNDDARVRTAAINALSNFQHSEAFDSVEFLLTDQDDEVRRAAFDTLLKIDPEQAERPVRAALSDENFWLQIAGIECVNERQMKLFNRELFTLLGSGNKMVQMKAVEALLNLFPDEIEEELTQKLNELGEDGVAIITTAKEQKDANWF